MLSALRSPLEHRLLWSFLAVSKTTTWRDSLASKIRSSANTLDSPLMVSRTALLYPQGETSTVSMGLRGLAQALTKIAAQPERDFGELVRQRRRSVACL